MSETFCPLLFQHLATHPHGGVTHCCIADHRKARSSAKDGENRYYNLNRALPKPSSKPPQPFSRGAQAKAQAKA